MTIPIKPAARSPTVITYLNIDTAFRHFDQQLFDGALRDRALITFQRRDKKIEGYFSRDRFIGRQDGQPLHEIALNPLAFPEQGDARILAALVHNMVHLDQVVRGQPASAGYHDQDWADRMEAVGLIPTATGEIGGPRTGEWVTQIIEKGGRFDRACSQLLANGRRIVRYEDRSDEQTERQRAKRAASHTLFRCPRCPQKVRGAPTTNVDCGVCRIQMRPPAQAGEGR